MAMVAQIQGWLGGWWLLVVLVTLTNMARLRSWWEGDYWGGVVDTLHAKGAIQKMRNKYKIGGWYVTMVRGNVTERTTGQPTIPPHPHQEKDWPNLMVTQCVVLFVVLCCWLNSVMLYCTISSTVQWHPVCGIVLLGQEQGVVLFVVLYC